MAYDNVKEVDCLDVSKEGTEAWDAACKRYLTNSVLLTASDWCQVTSMYHFLLFIRFCLCCLLTLCCFSLREDKILRTLQNGVHGRQ